MIEFANEAVRAAFHSISVEGQRKLGRVAEIALNQGLGLYMLYVEETADGQLEVSVRLDKKFDVVRPVEGNPSGL